MQRDDAARKRLGQPDATMTLFHWGFAIDEQLRDRLSSHKRHEHAPADALPSLWIRDPFERAQLESYLSGLCPALDTKAEPGGRRVARPAEQLEDRASQLARALMPLSDT